MNSIMPLVSIIIPVYNGSDYLGEAIDSALVQTYKNVEVIVVNDGSDDDGRSAAIGRSYGNKIRYFEKENGGVSSALNYGLKLMQGDFFSWLSHDDLYYPEKIEKQLSHYQKFPGKTIIFSDSDLINANGRIISKAKPLMINQEKIYYDLIANNIFLSGCTLLIPVTAFSEVGVFTSTYRTVQDYEMWLRMINAGYRLQYLPVSTVKTRIHPQQDSKAKRALFIGEKNDFYNDALVWFDRNLWLNNRDNKAAALFLMAKNYKRNRLFKVYRKVIQMGLAELKYLNYHQRGKALVAYLDALLWSRYLSPGSYINKCKLLLGRY